eukprot:gnl/Trimastix_PCT/3807.p1 GENE.gnl/Trimastix_PCT/3807~~gnl/Trimastix_PCT/3807.p1  ORF type:complete len:281 (-),score=42.32 gnl/Trimastix_PCT/3807:14-856(-)
MSERKRTKGSADNQKSTSTKAKRTRMDPVTSSHFPPSINDLCDDVLISIFSLLDPQESLLLRVVCRKWRHLIESPSMLPAHLYLTVCRIAATMPLHRADILVNDVSSAFKDYAWFQGQKNHVLRRLPRYEISPSCAAAIERFLETVKLRGHEDDYSHELDAGSESTTIEVPTCNAQGESRGTLCISSSRERDQTRAAICFKVSDESAQVYGLGDWADEDSYEGAAEWLRERLHLSEVPCVVLMDLLVELAGVDVGEFDELREALGLDRLALRPAPDSQFQ